MFGVEKKKYYKLLGVAHNASTTDIELAFSEIKGAYEVLVNPELRRIYDKSGEAGIKKIAFHASPPSTSRLPQDNGFSRSARDPIPSAFTRNSNSDSDSDEEPGGSAWDKSPQPPRQPPPRQPPPRQPPPPQEPPPPRDQPPIRHESSSSTLGDEYPRNPPQSTARRAETSPMPHSVRAVYSPPPPPTADPHNPRRNTFPTATSTTNFGMGPGNRSAGPSGKSTGPRITEARTETVAATAAQLEAGAKITKYVKVVLPCSNCEGKGAPKSALKTCRVCNGRGKVHKISQSASTMVSCSTECASCAGRGVLFNHKEACKACKGSAQRESNQCLIVNLQDQEFGQVVTFPGQGDQTSPEMLRGDLNILLVQQY